MASFRDFIANRFGGNSNNQYVTPMVLNEDGTINQQKSLDLENQTKPLTLGNRFFGRTLTRDVDNATVIDPETGEASLGLGRYTSTRPGLLTDIASGYQENFNNPMDLTQYQQGNNNNRGLAYRTGEGLGTVGRILNSPLGRMALTAGIVGATGGSGLQALAYGGSAGVLNQQKRASDKLYRQSLEEQGIDTSNIGGYIDEATYKNLSNNLYRYGKMDKDNYLKNLQFIQRLHQNRQIDDATASRMIQEVNSGYLNTQNVAAQASNQTRNTDSMIDYRNTSLTQRDRQLNQGDRRLDLLEKKIQMGQATNSDKAEYNRLKIDKINEEIRILKGYGGGGNPTPTPNASVVYF